MKIKLLTYHFSDNYGALYQAYALRKWFECRGLSADFLNYHPVYVEEGGALDRPWKASLWRKNATILYMKLSYWQRQLFGDREQRKAFESFRREYLGVTGTRRRSAGDLQDDMNGVSMLVCGSDQIWNPSIQRGLDPVYFLNIPGAEEARKVAYAPSFGRSSIEPSYYAELNRLLHGLDAISVREATGLDVLEAAGISREWVQALPDPTILLGDFSSLLKGESQMDNSVFCYALRSDEVIRDVAQTAAKYVGGPLYSPRNSRQRWRDIGTGVVPGPVEWLRMLNRAQLVVSNSFHGIALSIVLNRPFIAVGLPGKRSGMNVRALNLLKLAGLTDRLVSEFDAATVSRLADTPIDWEEVNARLAVVRAEAEAYLDEQIVAVQDQISMTSEPTTSQATTE